MKTRFIWILILLLIIGIGIGAGITIFINKDIVNEDKEEARENVGKTEEKMENAVDAEEIYQQSCAGCHEGGNLSIGPSLKGVSDRLSDEQIKEMMMKGSQGMPARIVSEDEASALTEWLKTVK